MIWRSTIIKGKLTGVSTRHTVKTEPAEPHDPGIPTLHLRSEGIIYLCPTTDAFINQLNIYDRIGQNVIVTAILNADGRLIDTMTLLMEP